MRASPLITVIDAALIVVVSAAIGVVLGARTYVDLSGARITIRGAGNLVWIAAVLAAIRLTLDRGQRLLPALPIPGAAAIETERLRIAKPVRPSQDVWSCALAALLGSVVWIVPHLLRIRDVPDVGDPVFSAWRIAWLAHQITTDPRHLFDANIFYPLPFTFTYSDPTLLQGFLGLPFVLSGIDPLIVSNGLTLIAFPACGLAFFYASWRLTGDPRAAVVAALVAAWYPFHAEHYHHLELQWLMFVPLATVAGLRMLADPSAQTGARFGLWIALQWLACLYVGAMLVAFLVPLIVMAAIAWRIVPSRQMAIATLAAAALLLPVLVALGLPYVLSRSTRGERDVREIQTYSAVPADYSRSHIRLAAYRGKETGGHQNERELFPGTSTLALAGIGVIPACTGVTIGTVVAGAMAFDWSLGLNGLTYDNLLRMVSVYRSMRVPARFSAMVGVALALLAGYGAKRLLTFARTPRAAAGLTSILVVGILFDLRLDPMVTPYLPGVPAIYAHVTPDMVLVELPAERQIEFMYFSTTHWAKLLGGYSGYPGYSSPLTEGWKVFPSPEAIALFRQAGATHLTYNCALEPIKSRCTAVFAALNANPALTVVSSDSWSGSPVRLYRITQ